LIQKAGIAPDDSGIESGDGGQSMTQPEDKQRIFNLVSSVPPERRGEILDRECGGDASLRTELEDLLLSADLPGSGSEAPTMAAEGSTGSP
jgi:hypothetical protein